MQKHLECKKDVPSKVEWYLQGNAYKEIGDNKIW